MISQDVPPPFRRGRLRPPLQSLSATDATHARRALRGAAPLLLGLVIGLAATLAASAQTNRSTVTPRPVYPGTRWETATPASQGLDPQILAAEIAALPAPANQGPLMVVANGRIVYSIGHINSAEYLYSCSKAITGMVAARLVEDGRIADLDTLIPNTVPGAWAAYPGDATLRMFLNMTSDYGLAGTRSPGQRYAYNNHAVDFLGEYLSRAFYGLGPDRMHTVVQRALTVDIGRQDSFTFTGQWGGWYGGLKISCRDLARFGLLLMRDGMWNDRRVLDESFTRSLWRRQIPATAQRYTSSSPNENSMWNQQAVTDLLGDQWSFGLWRVGDLRPGGSFAAAAMEGYRGKRVVMCPRGTLPNPDLELMLVCLPALNDEGPTSAEYRDAMLRAVVLPERHPEHDPRCVTATFDDGTAGPLDVRLGTPTFANSRMTLTAPTRLAVTSATWADGTVVFTLPNGLPTGARCGAVLRANSADDDVWGTTGSQTWAAAYHDPAGALRGTILFAANGTLQWFNSPPLSRSAPGNPLTVRIDHRGDTVRVRINGEDAFGTTGHHGVPTPFGGGYFGLRSSGHSTPIDVDYVLARPADGPIGQVATDANGDHTLAILAPDHLGNLPPGTFKVEYDDLVLDAAALPVVVPFVWPRVVALANDHLILSSRGAPVGLDAGKPLVIEIGSIREGEILR